MQTYATYTDYTAVKRITQSGVASADETLLRDYLRRATRTIDGITRRRFFPFYETRRFSVPTQYVDLRQRAFVHDDLMLDRDLLEAFQLQVGNGTTTDSTETVPLAGITARATTFTATDVDGLDAEGNPRFAVGDILQIDNELMPVEYINTSTNLVQVTRGAFGTLASAHSAGVSILKLFLMNLVPGIDFHPLDFNIRPIIGLRVVWPQTWTGRYTGSTWRFRYPQIYARGYWGYHEVQNEWWVDTLQTVAVGGITASTATLAYTAPTTDSIGETAVLDGYLYRIDNELIWGGAISGANQTVLRGQNGTVAVPHDQGTPIYRFSVLHDVREACIDMTNAIRLGDESVGGRQGVSEVSVGVQISYSKDTNDTLKRLVRSVI